MNNNLTPKQKEMIEIIRKNAIRLDKYTSSLKYYYANDIPEKVETKIVKNFDSRMAINSIVAYIDTTLTHNCKEGVVFLEDGVYMKGLFDRYYVNYNDILSHHRKGIKDEYIIVYSIGDNQKKEISYLSSFIDWNCFGNILTELIGINKDYEIITSKLSGEVKKIDLPPQMGKKCKKIIHASSVACGGIGAITAASIAADSILISTIQIPMVLKLASVFELDISEALAKSIVLNYAATFAGKRASQFFWGKIPFLGNGINLCTAFGLTEAVGWATALNFYNRWVNDQSKGFSAGVKQGFIVASDAFEKKYVKLTDEMCEMKKEYINKNDEYEKLCEGYEKYIEYLERVIEQNMAELKELYEKQEFLVED